MTSYYNTVYNNLKERFEERRGVKCVQHLPRVPATPCLVREEQIVSRTSLFFPGRGHSPVPTPNLSHQAKSTAGLGLK